MSAESRHLETQQSRSFSVADLTDHVFEKPSRFRRLSPVTIANVEILKRRQIFGDVAARRLKISGYRDSIAVVLDVEEDRQLERRSDRQRGPEAVGGHRCFASEHYRHGAVV